MIDAQLALVQHSMAAFETVRGDRMLDEQRSQQQF